ncbi:hypothetical protein [Desulfurispira natronophila]|uniref:SPOR domain-containing protein n=1 Tax=Desulfurispira natronophila TaxID=682562 RepID=A0A7W7Y476_9BACT|nr:hypothetical protein [Desulfurispira natronophila]MBB5021775.1 hypothetical protein [Desulfurispira natronophila]
MRKVNFLEHYQKGYYDIMESALEKPPPIWTLAGIKFYFFSAFWEEFFDASFGKKLRMLGQLLRTRKLRLIAVSAIMGIIVGYFFSPGRGDPELPHDVTESMVERARLHEHFIQTQGVPVGDFRLISQTSPYLPATTYDEPPLRSRLQVYYSFEAPRAHAVAAEVARTLGWKLEVDEALADRFGFRVIVEGYATMQMAESLRRELQLDHVIRREDRYYPASTIFFNRQSAEELARDIRYHQAMIITDSDRAIVYSVLTPPLNDTQIEHVTQHLRLLGYRPIRTS